MSMRPPGYTLMELLVVIAILALMASLAAPLASSMIDTMRFRSQASEISDRLSILQDRALRTRLPVSLEKVSQLFDNGHTPRGDSLSVEIPAPIIFYPDGTTTGGRIILRAPSRSQSINVAWLTGDTTVNLP